MTAERVQIIHDDCRAAVKAMADCSVDSVVSDPPYELASIAKRWGNAKPEREHAAKRNSPSARVSRGFMGKTWDTGEVAFDPEFWAEVLRVLKPGGYVLAFGGTRTYHRLTCAIEDAGFEIRDQVGWLYGAGFPKSHNIAKAIDKAAGAQGTFRREDHPGRAGGRKKRDGIIGQTSSHSTDANPEGLRQLYQPSTDDAKTWDGWGTALKPAWEPIVLARKPLIGTVAENVLRHGTGALNIDGCRVEATDNTTKAERHAGSRDRSQYRTGTTGATIPTDAGRWPANVIHDGSEEVVAAFPGEAGAFAPPSGDSLTISSVYSGAPGKRSTVHHGDSGSAARFFYSAKADADDRLGSKHPTVKPVDLMAYLVRLVTQPGGLVLDPFAGSGTTGVAAIAEGMRAILVEREAEYVADIRARIDWALGRGAHKDTLKARKVTEEKRTGSDLPLFGGAAE